MEENKNTEPEQPAENIPKVEQSEIPPSSGEIISSVQTTVPEIEETIIAEQQQTENMEVHHHTHTHTPHGKKNWISYFW